MVSMSVKTCLGLAVLMLTLAGRSCGNFPLLDVDTNMRIVLVPHDTPVGGIIYRLRASDSDNNFPLSFEVLGALGKSLLKLNFLGCVESESLCQADVVLKKTLDLDRTYEFQIQVKDTTGDYTKVHASITATSGTANFNPLFAPRIIRLDENSKEGTVLEKFEVLKNELNSRTVHLELRDTSERIGLKQRLVSNNRTEGTLFLNKELDFETEPWFTFQLLAMNGWTNTTIDTRNILVSEIAILIQDIQDKPPSFTLLPASVELNSSIKTGDLVVKIEAVDGDKQNKRLIRYGFLTDSNPFVVFFDLDPMSGEIRLRRNITELLAIAKPNEPIMMTIIAEEIITETGRSGRSIGSSLDRAMGNITFWFARGSSFGPPVFSSNKYIGEVKENSLPGTLVQFGMALRVSHQNPSEIINLSFSTGPSGGISSSSRSGNELLNAFQILPSQGIGNFSFEIRVAGSAVLDYEVYHEIGLMVMGSTTSGLFQEVELTIHLRDENDQGPVFSQSEYHVELAEHSPIGTKVLQIKATDKDTTGNYGQVVYSNLIGSDAFHLDPETGEITVDKPELIDRELEPEIRVYVEAKDGGYTEFGDPNVIRNIATATIVIKLLDRNDNRPEFLQKYYQAVLNPGFTSFKSPIFVKAYDTDEGLNSQVKYQSLDPKFFVDPTSGEVRLRGAYQRNPGDGDGPYLGSFRVRAYDLGNPQQSTETVVQLFSEEMVTREIQFVFPATPDRIRKNQTNIEKMLSSLTGGIVGIQKITPLGSRSSLVQLNPRGSGGRSDNNNNVNEGSLPTSSLQPTELPISSRSLDDSNDKKLGDGSSSIGSKKSEGLSSYSDKSLVTATVQYPVSATPTRVDLAAFNKAYMGSSEPETPGKGSQPPDADMIKLYEAENRALFWILITFLLILLILFAVFLCCIYCPCCWLYGHCYSKGAGSAYRGRDTQVERVVVEKRPIARHTRKTYPSEETEDSYDQDPEASYRRARYGRKEAWSEEDDKGTWRRPLISHVSHGVRQNKPLTPHGRGRERHVGGGHVVRAPEGDVSLEDWEFEPNHPRISDRADEIGPRWQHIQHQQNQQTLPQPQTITVPVPLPLMPLAMQQQQQQQMSQRRVGYVGHAHPGDDNFVRRQLPIGMIEMERRSSADQGGFSYVPAEMVPRNYPDGGRSGAQSLPPAESARAPRQRQTRFFKTETGEVLQFAEEFEGDEGKELLMKRYIDEQQPHQHHHQQQLQHQPFDPGERSLRRQGTPGVRRSNENAEESHYTSEKQISTNGADRPRAAVVTKRSQRKGVKEHEIPELDEVEEDEEIISKEEARKTTTKASKAKSTGASKKVIKPEGQQVDVDEEYPEDKDRDRDRRTNRSKRYKESEKKLKQRRSHSLSEDSDRSKSKSPSTKSKSKSRSKSPSVRKSKSQSPDRDGSKSPPEKNEKRNENESHEKESEEQQKKTRRHAHHHKRTSKHEKEDQKPSGKETVSKESKSTKSKKSTSKEAISEGIVTETVQKSAAILKSQNDDKETTKEAGSPEEDNDTMDQQNSNNNNVDINIIPPSSAPMTDSSYSHKDQEENSPPETPDWKDDVRRKHKHEEEVTLTTSTKKSSTVSEVVHVEGNNEESVVTQKTDGANQDEQDEEHQNQSNANISNVIHHQEDDDDSGIGIIGVDTSKRNKMLEKKSVFTIAYDEVAQKTLTIRPDTASNAEGDMELKSS